MINGGYILQPRIIQESDISVAPPYVREIWSYLLREANSCDVKYNGHEIKRGQLFRTYEEIREGTKWYIGWRKMMYNENHMKKAMKFLRDTHRITTMKELGGVMITILKYDYYQDPKNYERTTKAPKERTIAEPLQNHPLPDNNNNDKNKKNDNTTTWRDDFNIYLTECKRGYQAFIENPEIIRKEERLNPGINIKLTVEKGFQRFWGTEEGWKNKKAKRINNINWERTISNSIDQKMNRVYLTKAELAEK